jgi:hypothetical protein
MQSGFDRARAGANLGAGFGLRQAFEIEQCDRLALPVRERGDRGPHAARKLIGSDQSSPSMARRVASCAASRANSLSASIRRQLASNAG